MALRIPFSDLRGAGFSVITMTTKETDMSEMAITEWGPSHHDPFEPWAEDGDLPDDN